MKTRCGTSACRYISRTAAFFLNTTSERYDLITSEPPPPKMAGVVNLYSQEYFELIRSRLNPGGYVSYWLAGGQQLHTTDTLAITSAFCNAFENCSLWAGAPGSNGCSSARTAPRPDRISKSFSAQWQDPVTLALNWSRSGFEKTGAVRLTVHGRFGNAARPDCRRRTGN